MARTKLLGPLALLATLGGCAGGSRVTILPPENGHDIGGVELLDRRGKTLLLDKVGEQATTADPTMLRIKKTSRLQGIVKEVDQSFPPPARAFVITFPAGTNTIPEDQRFIFEQIRNELSKRPGAEIVIQGFTDSSGDSELNDKVSLDRAQAVANQMGEFGFQVDGANVVGRGEREAVLKLGDNVARDTYRRVEVIVR